MSASGDKLVPEGAEPKVEKRKSMRITSEKRENSSGKEKKEKEKEKEKHKDKKEKDKDKKEKDKDKKDKKEKEKSKDKTAVASTSAPRPSLSPSVSSAVLTPKERKSLFREGSTGSTGSDGKEKRGYSTRTLKLGRKRSTRSEPMPEPAKLLEIWNQLLVRLGLERGPRMQSWTLFGLTRAKSAPFAALPRHFRVSPRALDEQKCCAYFYAENDWFSCLTRAYLLTQCFAVLFFFSAVSRTTSKSTPLSAKR